MLTRSMTGRYFFILEFVTILRIPCLQQYSHFSLLALTSVSLSAAMKAKQWLQQDSVECLAVLLEVVVFKMEESNRMGMELFP